MPSIYDYIANPTQGKLGDIGQSMLQIKQLQMQKEAQDITNQLNRANLNEAQLKNAYTQSKVIGGYSEAVMDWVSKNPKDAQDPIKFAAAQSTIRETMPEGFKAFIPAETQPLEQIQEGLKRGKIVRTWFETEKQDSITKWQYEQAMIDKKNRNPDKWSADDQEKLDALQREPSYPIPQASPSGDVEAKSFFNSLQYGDDQLKGNVENEQEYRARLSSRAKEIFGERKKSRDPISMASAFDQAFQESVERGELEVSDILYEKTGIENPLGKKYKFNPNAGKSLPEGMSEAFMKASLARSGFNDTPANREIIAKEYLKRKTGEGNAVKEEFNP
ncbi:MAG: hypothetical protein KJO69_03765 [Gammaproteobacteria bacterium]|nr:hypothetical protein [Gammaproteobacteria bacterium]